LKNATAGRKFSAELWHNEENQASAIFSWRIEVAM